MSASKNQENPFMNDLPLRDYIAMQMVIADLNSGKVLNQIDIESIVHVAHTRANTVIAARYDYILLELDSKIETLNQEAEAENAKIMASFTPEVVRSLQADFTERKENEKNGLFNIRQRG